MVSRIGFGIENFEKLSEEGISKGDLVLVEGDYGTGKTILGLQYIVKGLTEQGELGVFVTFNDSLEEIRMDAKHLDLHLKKFERGGSIDLVSESDRGMNGFSDIEEKTGDALIDKIIEAVERKDAERLVIDGLERLSRYFEDSFDFESGVYRLNDSLKELGCTTVLTSETEMGIEDIVDDVIILHYGGGQVEKTRAIEIRKMHRSKHTNRLCPFEIGSGGIKITGYPENNK